MKLDWKTAGKIALVTVGTLVVLDVISRKFPKLSVSAISTPISDALPSPSMTQAA